MTAAIVLAGVSSSPARACCDCPHFAEMARSSAKWSGSRPTVATSSAKRLEVAKPSWESAKPTLPPEPDGGRRQEASGTPCS